MRAVERCSLPGRPAPESELDAVVPRRAGSGPTGRGCNEPFPAEVLRGGGQRPMTGAEAGLLSAAAPALDWGQLRPRCGTGLLRRLRYLSPGSVIPGPYRRSCPQLEGATLGLPRPGRCPAAAVARGLRAEGLWRRFPCGVRPATLIASGLLSPGGKRYPKDTAGLSPAGSRLWH